MFYTESDGNSYPAEKRVRCIGGRKVVTWGREITSCNMLEVEAGTNGYQGGDTGHGSRTYLRLKDLGGTDMECHVEEDKYVGGDTELETMKEALRWMLTVLEAQSETEG